MTAKYKRNNGKPWTTQNEKQLAQLATANTPTRVIGLKLGRTVNSIYKKAGELNIGLGPTNQSPYNRRNK